MDKTPAAYRELGPKRYRETSGLYYEDFEVGDVFEHRPGRTITDVDNIWMTLLTLKCATCPFRCCLCLEDRVEEAAGGQHVHTCTPHWHERPNHQRQGRCQPGMGQGQGDTSGFRRGHALRGIDGF